MIINGKQRIKQFAKRIKQRRQTKQRRNQSWGVFVISNLCVLFNQFFYSDIAMMIANTQFYFGKGYVKDNELLYLICLFLIIIIMINFFEFSFGKLKLLYLKE